MPILPPTLVAKLDPLIRRLASIHDGEVVATARAIERRLRAERFDLNDLAETVRRQAPPLAPQQPQPAWREMRSFCLQHRSRLSARELEFVTDLGRWRGSLTDKQFNWLSAIHARLSA
jgi:hypothetical protein